MELKKKIRWCLAASVCLMIIGTWSDTVLAAPPGSKLYQKNCKKCHGESGQGKISKADSSQFKYPPIHEMLEDDLLQAMANYKKMWLEKTYTKKEKRMAKSAGRLRDEETKALIVFIRSQMGP